jgi:hypothetical protein
MRVVLLGTLLRLPMASELIPIFEDRIVTLPTFASTQERQDKPKLNICKHSTAISIFFRSSFQSGHALQSERIG